GRSPSANIAAARSLVARSYLSRRSIAMHASRLPDQGFLVQETGCGSEPVRKGNLDISWQWAAMAESE
ncbi:hypothetical protein, partial [Enorma massiliensis]|uniref:hypothetical protein n=1 Tax=Enorma massiliensis TaxID=1472761 RepID=UPI003A955724